MTARPALADLAEVRSLTGLRGVAACYVMSYHFFLSNEGLGPVTQFVHHGYLAIELFFVLSGFVIAMIYGARFAAGASIAAYRDFLVRRIGRVYPLYIIVLAVLIIAGQARLIETAAPSTVALVSNALMVQTWGISDSINGTTWSISTEFAAYLLFPIIAATILRGERWRAAVVVPAAAVVLLALSQVGVAAAHQIYDGIPSRNGPLDLYGANTPLPLLRCLAEFSLGVAAFRLRDVARAPWVADAAACAALAALTVPGADVLFAMLCAPLVAGLATSDRSIAARCLGSAPIHWLGVASYSIYLTHRLTDDLCFYPLMGLVKAAGVPHAFSVARVVVIGIVLVISAITYYGIENPAREAVRQLVRRRPSVATG